MKLSDEEIRLRKKFRDDFPFFSPRCLFIRTEAGTIEPLRMNETQTFFHNQLEKQKRETGKVRALALKGRQQGISTYTEGRFFHRCIHNFGLRAFILTHDKEATDNLFSMAKRYYSHCPEVLRPTIQASNSKELLFDGLDSGYKVGTAGNDGVGRSSTIQLFHGSEVAFWPHAAEHAKGILNAVPNGPGTEIILESTANGTGNFFHEQWQAAEAGMSEYNAIFMPWYWKLSNSIIVPPDFYKDDEEKELQALYGITDGQLGWRRLKIAGLSMQGQDGLSAFKQEYPSTATEAFIMSGESSFIQPSIVVRARKSKAEGVGPLLIGVDPARFGDDRTSIIRRRGRRAFKLETYKKIDVMEVVGRVHKVIIEEKPAKVYIDIGGLGAGVYDRLKELGYSDIIVGVNAGSKPLDLNRYINKRAEMWAEMRAWLMDEPVEIPDDDCLHADLTHIQYSFDSNTRLRLEKKEDMKKRGIRSPDAGDALALTFAMPPTALMANMTQKASQDFATMFGQSSEEMERLRNSAYRR